MGGGQHHYRGSRCAPDSAKAESGKGRGHRRVPLEQNRAVMRILKLTPDTEKWLLARREKQDAEAHLIAAEIVQDVRKREDAALFAYTKKFDQTDLAKTGVWIEKKEIRAARKASSVKFLKAIEKATENVRRVSEKQLPRPWTVETAP